MKLSGNTYRSMRNVLPMQLDLEPTMIETGKMAYLDPTEEMNNRWFKLMKGSLS